MAFAEAQFALDRTIEGSKPPITQRDYLRSQAEQNDPEALAELAALPVIPRHCTHLWDWFIDLHATRQSNGMGPSRLTRHEIRLWQEDEGVVLEPWERRALVAVDALWVRSVNEQQEERAAANAAEKREPRA